MIGKMISHYKILDKIGEGGMGVVYKAEDTRLERPVAIKFLAHQRAAKEEERQRFGVEAKAAAALNHPNIATIHAVEEVDEQTFIVMEFVDGEELRSKMTAGPLSLQMLIDIAGQIAEGLHEAHQKGVVHRDIKPANIMLTSTGRVKIMDFGLAKIANRTKLTQTGITLGTVAYMSPEQASGAEVDHRTDIWSLGVMLYEMATGKQPFTGDYEPAVVYSIVNETPKPVTGLRTGVPMALERIITKAIAKNPDERYQHADEMLVDLKTVGKELESGTGAASAIPSRKEETGHQGRLKTALAELAQHRTEVKGDLSMPGHTVGRARETGRLLAGFESAGNGKGQLLCVTGEAGMGKTTLIETFFQELQNNGKPCFIARGQSSERLGSTEGYLPILEALESLLRSSAGSSIAEILKLVASTWYVEVVPVSPDDPSDAVVIADAKAASPERKKRELAAFLQDISSIWPLVLFFDDLHWADISTVDVLAFIGNKCNTMPLLIVVAYRPAELLLSENQFAQVKLNLQAHRVCYDVALEFLSLADVNSYLELQFPENAFPKDFAGVIHRQTEGSPLFIVDLIRNLHDNGVIDRESGRWLLKQSVTDIKRELPESIRGMIRRKIDRLTEPERQLLIVASVQGDEFDSAVLAKVLNKEPVEVEESLEVLAHVHSFVRLLEEREFPNMTPTLHYAFVHILYQNTFHESLSMTRKATLSLSVAEVLLSYYGDRGKAVASELAFLFEVGRDFIRASDCFFQAAHNAIRIHANQEAIDLLQRSMTNAEKLRGQERAGRIVDASLESAQLHFTMSQLDKAITDFERAQKVAKEADNHEKQIIALCGIAYTNFITQRIAETLSFGKRAHELALSTNSSIGIASSQVVLANERMCVGDLETAEQYFEKAIPVMREKGVPRELIVPLSFRSWIPAWRLDYKPAINNTEWVLREAEAIGLEYQKVQGQFILGLILGNQGHMSSALSQIEEAIRMAERLDARVMINRLPNCLGWLYSELQDHKTAFTFNAESVTYARDFGEAEPEANAHVNLAHDHILLGELDRAFEHLQAAEELFKKDLWFRWRYNLRTLTELANYWVIKGELVEAKLQATKAFESAEKTLSRKYISLSHKLLGDIAVLEDRVEAGKQHYQKALATLAHHPCPTIEWKILKAASDLAKMLKDDSAASDFRGRAKSVVQSLADSVTDASLRKKFLSSQAIREL